MLPRDDGPGAGEELSLAVRPILEMDPLHKLIQSFTCEQYIGFCEGSSSFQSLIFYSYLLLRNGVDFSLANLTGAVQFYHLPNTGEENSCVWLD